MHLIIPRSLSMPCLSDFFSLFFYFSCLFSLQVCRDFVRTLKWWLVSSQTDSGDSAGPSWLQPFWRYILAFFFFAQYIPSLTYRHTDKCSLKQLHFQCCCLSCSSICFWKGVWGEITSVTLKWKIIPSFYFLSCHQASSLLFTTPLQNCHW